MGSNKGEARHLIVLGFLFIGALVVAMIGYALFHRDISYEYPGKGYEMKIASSGIVPSEARISYQGVYYHPFKGERVCLCPGFGTLRVIKTGAVYSCRESQRVYLHDPERGSVEITEELMRYGMQQAGMTLPQGATVAGPHFEVDSFEQQSEQELVIRGRVNSQEIKFTVPVDTIFTMEHRP